jgi:hypothetical protein
MNLARRHHTTFAGAENVFLSSTPNFDLDCSLQAIESIRHLGMVVPWELITRLQYVLDNPEFRGLGNEMGLFRFGRYRFPFLPHLLLIHRFFLSRE